MPRLSHVQQEALHQLRQVASRPLFPEQLGVTIVFGGKPTLRKLKSG